MDGLGWSCFWLGFWCCVFFFLAFVYDVSCVFFFMIPDALIAWICRLQAVSRLHFVFYFSLLLPGSVPSYSSWFGLHDNGTTRYLFEC